MLEIVSFDQRAGKTKLGLELVRPAQTASVTQGKKMNVEDIVLPVRCHCKLQPMRVELVMRQWEAEAASRPISAEQKHHELFFSLEIALAAWAYRAWAPMLCGCGCGCNWKHHTRTCTKVPRPEPVICAPRRQP